MAPLTANNVLLNGDGIVNKRVVIAIVASFPVAVVAGLSLSRAIELGDAFSTVFFWLVWGGSVFYALRETEPRRVFGRTAIAYAVAALSLPLTATVFALTSADRLGAPFFEVFIVLSVILGVFGIVTGLVAVFVARSSLKRQVGQESEDTQSA